MKNIAIAVCALGMSFTALAACPVGTSALGVVQNKEACGLKGTYTQDLLLTSDKLWVLQGGVFIGNDNKDNANITIQAGSKIVGQSGADFLVITRGSKILAEGAADRPIVFTAAKEENRTPGLWGGIVINGNAPINACKEGTTLCEAEGEGSTGKYGGNDAHDNSGILKFVRVEFAGYQITPENELNGIAFQGVGDGTLVDYIQVHRNSDDGVEFFGGTVNIKHVVLTGNQDDSLDWTSGWRGKVQFVVVEQYEDEADCGIEADNHSSRLDAAPRSMPEISNVTLIGNGKAGKKGGHGVLLRKGTGAIISNALVTNFKKACIDIDDNETFNFGGILGNRGVEARGLKMSSTIVDCEASSQNFQLVETGASGNVVVEPWSIDSWFFGQMGNLATAAKLNGWVPSANSPVHGAGITPDDLFFDEVDYIGAIANEANDWTFGWTTQAKN
jgi:hypothetical protein